MPLTPPARYTAAARAPAADEYAFILSGSVSCETEEDGVLRLGPGGASFIPAGQRHSSRNDGPGEAELIWALVEK